MQFLRGSGPNLAVLLLELYLALLQSLGACVDVWLFALLTRGRDAPEAGLTTAFAALAKVSVASLLLLAMVRVKVLPVQAIWAQEIMVTSWLSFTTISILIALLTLGAEPLSSNKRILVFLVLRLIDLLVCMGAATVYSSRRSRRERIHREILGHASRIATFESLKEGSAAEQIELSNLSCCVCLDEFCLKEAVLVLPCNHVAHKLCAYKSFVRIRTRGLRRSAGPMQCKGSR
eukprot:TRINITY_DN39769_c0_g1_i1.p1 TRINITY_DN39769_c0_g1~~TRINITY_DN39769_c0_g1_i1.p1  ORF type:complete len:243 (+),score=29.51 TRINITY_DN39769_c0_g1_i1:33-731(+)